jgi:hypothetical protein
MVISLSSAKILDTFSLLFYYYSITLFLFNSFPDSFDRTIQLSKQSDSILHLDTKIKYSPITPFRKATTFDKH